MTLADLCSPPQADERLDPSGSLALIEELNHRVLNEFTEVILCLSSAAQCCRDPFARDALDQATQRVAAHANAHRALAPPVAGRLINVPTYIGRLCACLAEAALAESGVRLVLHADDAWLDADRCWRIGLILAELVRNAARHGLRGGPGLITVRICRQGGRLSCLVGDDGWAEGTPNAGRGQLLIRSLAAQLGGTVDWLFTPIGTLARFQAPVASSAA